METQDVPDSDADSDENMVEAAGIGIKTDEDFHAMMSVIVEELVEMQAGSFIWDHHDPDQKGGFDWPTGHFSDVSTECLLFCAVFYR
jgi:hypothetical protein